MNPSSSNLPHRSLPAAVAIPGCLLLLTLFLLPAGADTWARTLGTVDSEDATALLDLDGTEFLLAGQISPGGGQRQLLLVRGDIETASVTWAFRYGLDVRIESMARVPNSDDAFLVGRMRIDGAGTSTSGWAAWTPPAPSCGRSGWAREAPPTRATT